MATYESMRGWAERTGRVQVKFYLPSDVVEAIDEQARIRSTTDPITGKVRKIGRPEVITEIIRKGWKSFAETVEGWKRMYEDVRDSWDESRDRENELSGEVAELSSKLAAAERQVDNLTGRLESATARLKEVEGLRDTFGTLDPDKLLAELRDANLKASKVEELERTVETLRAAVSDAQGGAEEDVTE